MYAKCMQLRRVKPIRIIVKNVITEPKNHVTNFIFIMKLVSSVLAESQKLKQSG